MKRWLSLAAAAVLLAIAIPGAVMADNGWTMYVYTENGGSLNVRSSERVENNVLGTLRYGTAVTVYALYNGWAMIWYPYTSGGYHTDYAYVQSRYLVYQKPSDRRPAPAPTAAPAPSSNAAQVLAEMNAEFRSAKQVTAPYTIVSRPSRASGWVNLRWAPTMEAERIAACPQGKELIVLAVLKNWYQVRDPATGMIGFISSKYVIVK